jgi:hypothetical protein
VTSRARRSGPSTIRDRLVDLHVAGLEHLLARVVAAAQPDQLALDYGVQCRVRRGTRWPGGPGADNVASRAAPRPQRHRLDPDAERLTGVRAAARGSLAINRQSSAGLIPPSPTSGSPSSRRRRRTYSRTVVSATTAPCSSTSRCQIRFAVCRCLHGASRSARSHPSINRRYAPSFGAGRPSGRLRGGGNGDASACRTARRRTPCRRASPRIDNPSRSRSLRIRPNSSTLDPIPSATSRSSSEKPERSSRPRTGVGPNQTVAVGPTQTVAPIPAVLWAGALVTAPDATELGGRARDRAHQG